MFPVFKSLGFGLMQSHIQKSDRLERLILIVSTALYSPRSGLPAS